MGSEMCIRDSFKMMPFEAGMTFAPHELLRMYFCRRTGTKTYQVCPRFEPIEKVRKVKLVVTCTDLSLTLATIFCRLKAFNSSVKGVGETRPMKSIAWHRLVNFRSGIPGSNTDCQKTVICMLCEYFYPQFTPPAKSNLDSGTKLVNFRK